MSSTTQDPMQEHPGLILSLICGVLAAGGALFKAVHLAHFNARARYASFSVLIAGMALMFCFVTLLLWLWSRTSDRAVLAENRANWQTLVQLIWWLQALAYIGTCAVVFLDFERGPLQLTWHYSSSMAFLFGIGQIVMFAYYFRCFVQSFPAREAKEAE